MAPDGTHLFLLELWPQIPLLMHRAVVRNVCEHFLNAAWGHNTADRRGRWGRRGRGNVCLSTNHCQDISREAAVTLCVTVRVGSRVRESQDHPCPGCPCMRSHAHRPPRLFSCGQFQCPALSHIRNPFPRRPWRGVLHSWDQIQPAMAQGTAGWGFQMQE